MRDVHWVISETHVYYFNILLQSTVLWTRVLLHNITKYSHAHTHIHILSVNSHHWLPCKSANVGIAAGNTTEVYLQEGPIAAATLSTVLEQLTCTSIEPSWISSSYLTNLGRSVCTSSSKLALPCAKVFQLKHNTFSQGFFDTSLLDHLNVLLAYLSNFWQNLKFSYRSNCDILNFHCTQSTTLHSSDFFSEYTTCMQLLLAGMREEWIWHHLVAPLIGCCEQRHYATIPWNYWFYYMYDQGNTEWIQCFKTFLTNRIMIATLCFPSWLVTCVVPLIHNPFDSKRGKVRVLVCTHQCTLTFTNLLH
jgi:hypothetical protein